MIEAAPRIILVEGDHLQSGPLVTAIAETIPQAAVTLIKTESDFRDKFPGIIQNPPHLVVSEVIVRWVGLTRKPVPPDVVEDCGAFKAGLRIRRMLAENPATENVPFLFLATLQADDLKTVRSEDDNLAGAYFLPKMGLQREAFFEDVQDLLRGDAPTHATLLPEFTLISSR